MSLTTEVKGIDTLRMMVKNKDSATTKAYTQMEGSTQPQRELTFGEKAAGVNFNPGGHPKVDEIKTKFADIIDICNDLRTETNCTPGAARYYSKAISAAEDAQMNAVKAITWQQ